MRRYLYVQCPRTIPRTSPKQRHHTNCLKIVTVCHARLVEGREPHGLGLVELRVLKGGHPEAKPRDHLRQQIAQSRVHPAGNANVAGRCAPSSGGLWPALQQGPPEQCHRLHRAEGHTRRASAGDPCRAGSKTGGGAKAAADSSAAGSVKTRPVSRQPKQTDASSEIFPGPHPARAPNGKWIRRVRSRRRSSCRFWVRARSRSRSDTIPTSVRSVSLRTTGIRVTPVSAIR